MRYNVFSDFHHASLLQSFILLFEKRLGGQVFRPIGMEWAEKGFWKVYDHPETQAQYLGIGSATPDGTEPLNEVEKLGNAFDPSKPLIYHCHDIDSGQTNKAITFEGFMQTPIDIVIASLPQHIEPFKKLCELHPNKPKLIYQVGNAWTYEGDVKNVMASAKIAVPEGVNYIEYHQEFDLKTFYPLTFNYYTYPFVSSFVNVFNGQDHLKEDYKLFLEVERMMPGYTFKSYGGQCRDGAVGPSSALANKMREARFIWHTKQGGDGYGHIIHNAAAVARPLIVKKSYYSGKLGEKLMIDGHTCIDIDGLTPQQIVDKIVYYSEPSRYETMSKATYYNFKAHVDFDKEEIELRTFLENLL